MSIKPVLLWTDILFIGLTISLVVFAFRARKKMHWRIAWQSIIKRPIALVSIMVLAVYFSIGFLDSLHYQVSLGKTNGVMHYSPTLKSVLDNILAPIGEYSEKTYSAPFAYQLYVKESHVLPDASVVQVYPHLHYAAIGIDSLKQRNAQLIHLSSFSFFLGGSLFLAASLALLLYLSHRWQLSLLRTINKIKNGRTTFPWRSFFITLFIIVFFITLFLILGRYYHVFGTDKVGQDVFYQTLKSIRTGLIIGTLATLIMLPFAIFFGLLAGYFGGRIDDVIQYVYTTLSAIPSVLLIAAAVLSLQVYIANNAGHFNILAQRADARLLALCVILGVTSWTGLCRLLRAETLKLRESDYVQASISLGSSRPRILLKHILPNVMHVIFIAIALDFSGLVLAEAVLSYVGVGVSPITLSWGNMINSARLELAREPIVWWPMLAAFIFMFLLVLTANLFSDALRDAFDPRLRTQE